MDSKQWIAACIVTYLWFRGYNEQLLIDTPVKVDFLNNAKFHNEFSLAIAF